MIAAGAIPLPNGFYALWGIVLCAWLVLESRRRPERRRAVVLLRVAVAAFTLIAPAWELVWRAGQRIEKQSANTLYVIGDSLSAGIHGRNERTWPRRMREDRRIDLVDLSHVGATAGSALRQADAVEGSAVMVLIEIGGNDILGDTSVDRFARDLDALLSRLRRPGRQLVMLELPLPPFYNRYGAAQRRLARVHGVVLIPRREFAGVIFAPHATVDGLHFTDEGHRLMALMVWRQLAPAFGENLGRGETSARSTITRHSFQTFPTQNKKALGIPPVETARPVRDSETQRIPPQAAS